jgi:dipeptidyl aminopeptidase/acylaminoacyl peptidase
MNRRLAMASGTALILLSLSCGPGTALVELYDSHAVGAGDRATWSPDGKSIAFLHRKRAPSSDWGPPPGSRPDGAELLVARADGSDAVRALTPGLRVAYFRWSPDSRTIAFVTDKIPIPHPPVDLCAIASGGELGIVNADGENEPRMLTSGMFVDDPAWSPNSRELLCVVEHYRPTPEFIEYQVAEHADSYEFRVFDVAGGETWVLGGPFSGHERIVRRARWLNDGNLAVLGADSTHRPGWTIVGPLGLANPKVTSHEKLLWFAGSPPDTATWMMNADGSDTVRVTEPDWHPNWSSTARKVARVEQDSGVSRIFVTDSFGRHRRKVADSADSPKWFPDGKWLIYRKQSEYPWSGELYVASADTRYRGPLPRDVKFSPTGDRVVYMKRDSIVVSRIRVRIVRGNSGASLDWR